LPLKRDSRQQQDPEAWWASVCVLMEKLKMHLSSGETSIRLMSMAVTSTSGTVIPLDRYNRPVHPAIMYSDQRSSAQGDRIRPYAEAYYRDRPGYTQFGSSS